MSANEKMSRRRLLQTAVTIAPAAALAGCAGIGSQTSSAEPRERLLQPDDPIARTMAYYPDTRAVPADEPLAPDHSPSQKCGNCIHGRGPAGPGEIKCAIFSGRNVNEEGWCTLWAADRNPA